MGWAVRSSSDPGGQSHRYRIVEFTGGGDPKEFNPFAYEWFGVNSPGIVVDTLPESKGRLMFQPFSRGKAVYEVPYHDLKLQDHDWRARVSSEAESTLKAIETFDEEVLSWVPDASGRIRGAVTISVEPFALRIRYRSTNESEWKIARTITDEEAVDEIVPLGFTADGSAMLVATAPDGDCYGLYEYDPTRDTISRLVYEHPTADITGLVRNATGHEILGVTYFEEGEPRQAYFETADRRLREALERAFPARNPMITAMSRDGRFLSLRVSPPGDPGGYWLLDVKSGKTTEIGRIRPWLDNNLLATSESFQVRSTDDLTVTAFLTLPPMEVTRPPLIVMPHGGPIGVSDTRLFSPEIQYLARMGYAILRVNFRGSGAEGAAFERAGQRQWGRGIEAAIDHVVESDRVDGERICTHGASYGGYSGLMLAVRRPDAYRCASSLMGVTDIALMFNNDDVWLGESTVEKMEEIVGDPERDYAEQVEFSPVYNADKIRIPVLLAHGGWDRRVDWDHMIRMKIALELAGTPVRTIELRRTGHGFARRNDAIRYYKALRAFFVEHIGP